MANGPSSHLTWNELKCKDGTEYPLEWRTSRAVKLSKAFEEVRQVCGNKPIGILSAYRTVSWNARVGGAKNSQHKEGRALDLRPPVGMSVDQLYRIIVLVAKEKGLIRGIGKYKTFVHMDIRPEQNIAYWSGTGVKDSRNA